MGQPPEPPDVYWLIDEPSPFAPKAVMQEWLRDNDREIEAAATEGERRQFEEAKSRVLENLRTLYCSGLGDLTA